ncbi:hypothetical protein CK507_01975 [Pseudomonas sp. WN033]|nr:hypothetical protein CK507_01975 [Pseudomonas sp. WN033]
MVLGCPLWAESGWLGSLYRSDADADQRLQQYAQVFSAVEGNTTFYALPGETTVARWAELLPDDFRFCAKLPREISHGARLDPNASELQRFFQRLAPLQQRLGPIWLQLPARFGPTALAELLAFLDALPSAWRYAVEVRHADFFRKDETERQLNRQLHERGIERLIFDSRAVFASTADDPATREAKERKPRLPVHALALSEQPAVRFIGGMDNAANLAFLEPWLAKCVQWLEQGRVPMLFMHTPDNRLAPQLARQFHTRLAERVPDLLPMPAWPGELELAEMPVQDALF